MSDAGTAKDRALRKIAAVAAWATFRRVEVFRADTTTSDPGPLMSTSNHFGGFLDPLLTMYALPRRPRFIARDVIWRIPGARQIMNWVGAIPVHKADDRGAGSNDQMFASCYQALRQDEHLLIFPEGITRDQPSIGRVKTGTARIVLGARNSGVDGIKVVPVGIHYEDKAALRSRATVVVSEPIDLDAEIDDYVEPGADPGPDNRAAVRALTEAIEGRLRDAAPDFEDWREAAALTRASEISLRALGDPDRPVSLSQRERLASSLAHKGQAVKDEIVESLGLYERELDALALADQDVDQPTKAGFLKAYFARLIMGLLLLPYALMGLVVHAIPFLIVKTVGLLRLAPAAMASLKPIVAILAFGTTWVLSAFAAFQQWGWTAAWATLLVVPLYGIAAVVMWERLLLGSRALRARRGSSLTGSVDDVVLRRRHDLVERVVEAL